MKTILNSMSNFDKTNATSSDLYFIASQIVARYDSVTKIKALKADITETFGNYKDILSRCKEIIIKSHNDAKKAVIAQFDYESILSASWVIAKRDALFSAICADAEEKGLFTDAEDFVKRFYPYISEDGHPLVRQSYTDGYYSWIEYHERPISKFTDTFALQAIKASLRYYYDSARNRAISRKIRANEMVTDAPLKVAFLDELRASDTIDLEKALADIADSKGKGIVLTMREYRATLK